MFLALGRSIVSPDEKISYKLYIHIHDLSVYLWNLELFTVYVWLLCYTCGNQRTTNFRELVLHASGDKNLDHQAW